MRVAFLRVVIWVARTRPHVLSWEGIILTAAAATRLLISCW